MMITSDPVGAYVDSASTGQATVSVDPDGEILLGLRSLETHVHRLDRLPAPRGAVQKSTKEDLQAARGHRVRPRRVRRLTQDRATTAVASPAPTLVGIVNGPAASLSASRTIEMHRATGRS